MMKLPWTGIGRSVGARRQRPQAVDRQLAGGVARQFGDQDDLPGHEGGIDTLAQLLAALG